MDSRLVNKPRAWASVGLVLAGGTIRGGWVSVGDDFEGVGRIGFVWIGAGDSTTGLFSIVGLVSRGGNRSTLGFVSSERGATLAGGGSVGVAVTR